MSAFSALVARELKLAFRAGGEAMVLVLFFVMVGVIVGHGVLLGQAQRGQTHAGVNAGAVIGVGAPAGAVRIGVVGGADQRRILRNGAGRSARDDPG